jgi:diaminohydroxyphosphoribosylaminopyrimidine deaminase/5-amino-6-(5-phosphoribosylamino)uracil reductase
VLVVCWAPDPTHAAALEHAGVGLLHAATLAEALRALKGRGVHSILAEGGAALAASLLNGAFVDRLIIFRAPLVLGAGALGAFGGVEPATASDAARWRLLRSERFGDDEMSVYAP